MTSPVPPDSWKRIGATVRAFREMRGLTADELANKVGISRAYLANIEAGRKPLRSVLLAKIADALHVKQIAILDGPEPEDEP